MQIIILVFNLEYMVKVIAILLVLVLFSNCHSERSRGKNPTLPANINVDQEYDITLCTSLRAEIKSFSDELDSLTSDSFGIVVIVVKMEKTECSLRMVTQPYYDSKLLDGALLLNRRLFVFYIEDSVCSSGIMHFGLLSLPNILDYPDENNFELLGSYEPWGRKYKILCPDSLELVYKGYF